MGKVFDTSKIKVAVGLSGGVDSSVTALLLKEAGFDVTGVYLKCYWTHAGCTADKDRSSAAKVASFLNIPFEVWDFEKEYKEKVIDYFYCEYEKGRTPNPDVACNREIKFGLFYEKAVKERGLNFIATGHYSGVGRLTQKTKSEEQLDIVTPFSYQKIEEGDKKGIKLVVEPKYFRIFKQSGKKEAHLDTYYSRLSIFGGVDKSKDQSYFLYDIEEKAIEHSLYPLFGLIKSEVRQIAKAHNLPTASRPDSQGICFIGEVNIEKFLKARIAEHPGEVVDIAGNVIGGHKGIEFYTIGQRHGFKILNSQLSIVNYRGPLYVIGKDVGRNRLIVGAGEECKREAFAISKFKSQSSNLDLKSEKLFVRIRHLGELIPCKVTSNRLQFTQRSLKESSLLRQRADQGTPSKFAYAQSSALSRGDKLIPSTLEVKLDYPVFGIAPGQSAVFYVARMVQRSLVDDSDSVTLTQGVPPDHSIGVPPQRSLKHTSSSFNSTFAYAPPLTTGANVIWEVVGGGVIE